MTAHLAAPPVIKLKQNVLDMIGNTPIVELSGFSPNPAVRLFAKLESANPTGSVKDRVARALVESAEAKGLIKPGDTLLEPTSGNTGIGLAMVARVKGYKVRVVMPESVSKERVDLLRAFGAEIIFSPAEKGTNESIVLARQIADENPSYFMPFQYGNQANPDIHYHTTGPEIIRDVPDLNVFVAGLGTGGTLMGVGRALREHNPDIKIAATAPHADEKVQGLRSLEHGFIPPILDLDALDARIMIDAEEAFYWTRRLLSDAAVFVGMSSGAVFATALKLAERIDEGKIVCLFADGGWKYLSTGIYTKDWKEMDGQIEGQTWW